MIYLHDNRQISYYKLYFVKLQKLTYVSEQNGTNHLLEDLYISVI